MYVTHSCTRANTHTHSLLHTHTDLVISFSSAKYSVSETDTLLEVEVRLGEGIELQRDITLDLRSEDGAPPTGATGVYVMVVVAGWSVILS